MTRDKAISRVRKLRALAADRAATKHEAALARVRADELIERFELSEAEVAPEPVRLTPPPAPVSGWWVVVNGGANATTTTTGFTFNASMHFR